MTALLYKDNPDLFIGSRKDIGIKGFKYPGATTIMSFQGIIEPFDSNSEYDSTSNHSVSITESIRPQHFLTQTRQPNNIQKRIEAIIDTVIVEKTCSSTINKKELTAYIFKKINDLGFEKFQRLPDNIIKNRIEKVVAIELLKNLFSDIKEDEFDLIKTHAKSEGFFR